MNSPSLLPELTNDELIAIYKRYAKHSTAFLSLYEGYSYFWLPEDPEHVLGLIAYVDSPGAWIGAGDPIADPSSWDRLFQSFREGATKCGKSAVFLPVSEKASKSAQSAGFRAYLIGAEPWHVLSKEVAAQEKVLALNPAIQLRAKGAVAEKFSPEKISVAESLELQEVSREWLLSRKSEPLGFLNRLEPFSLPEYKEYYWVKYQGRIQGFLAAVPIWGINSWYLVDLIRRPTAPLGATELLVTGAMADLKKQGADQVTLGFTPLARLDEPRNSTSPLPHPLCRILYQKGSWIYNFRTLFEYKGKFAPDRWESRYLLSAPGRFGLKEALSLSQVLFPSGAFRSAWGWLKRKFISRQKSSSRSAQILTDLIVYRPVPESLFEFFQSSRFASFVCSVSIFLSLSSTNVHGVLREKMIKGFAFSFEKFLTEPTSVQSIKSILVSPFLSIDVFHLIASLLVVFSLVGLLEVYLGTALAGTTFMIGALLVWPLIGIVDYWFANPFTSVVHHQLLLAQQLGPSLGLLACVGGFHYLLSRRLKPKLLCLLIAVVTYALFGFAICISHLVAYALGYLWLRWQLPKRDPLFEVPKVGV